jgi:hypothetical protein
MSDAETIAKLELALDRAYRALCGYAMAYENHATLGTATIAYHAPAVAAAKQSVIMGGVDVETIK